MSKTLTRPNTVVMERTMVEEDFDKQCQVVLFNDDVSPMVVVQAALMQVFGHNEQIASKIMMEAHLKGRSIAEVEDREKARIHKNQLQNDYGLTVEVEELSTT